VGVCEGGGGAFVGGGGREGFYEDFFEGAGFGVEEGAGLRVTCFLALEFVVGERGEGRGGMSTV
jgi:hypothetical protein